MQEDSNLSGLRAILILANVKAEDEGDVGIAILPTWIRIRDEMAKILSWSLLMSPENSLSDVISLLRIFSSRLSLAESKNSSRVSKEVSTFLNILLSIFSDIDISNAERSIDSTLERKVSQDAMCLVKVPFLVARVFLVESIAQTHRMMKWSVDEWVHWRSFRQKDPAVKK